MNNISLTNVSIFVVAVSMASFFVNAENDIIQGSANTTEIKLATATDVTNAVKNVDEGSDKFTFTSLDTDKNGKLSHEEVVAGKNQWLVSSFKKIDGDADKSLTEQELVEFVAKTTAASK